jgi:2'-5' RNA ligase
VSGDPVRCFFAVELPPSSREAVQVAVAGMREQVPEGVRWIDPEAVHLTLKFLGELPPEALPKLLARAASRLVREQPFTVELAGTGAFPHGRAASVIWIGVGEGASGLARLARKLDAAGRGAGAPRERRPFRAHLTVGRLREPRPVAVERLAGPDSAGFRVEEVVLYESRLSSSGASYAPLARLPLGAEAGRALEFAPEL